MKNIKTILVLSLVLFISSTFSSCNKYEDGPFFSLSTAKKRLSRDWTLTNLTEDGTNIPLQGITHFISFDKSGSYTQNLTILSISVAESGTWTFSSDKKFVNLIKSGQSNTVSYRLMELRKTQFKVKSTENQKVYVRTFNLK